MSPQDLCHYVDEQQKKKPAPAEIDIAHFKGEYASVSFIIFHYVALYLIIFYYIS